MAIGLAGFGIVLSVLFVLKDYNILERKGTESKKTVDE